MKITIKNDVFNISKRIKQINNNFYIIFNNLKNIYEIYDKTSSKLVFSLPFKELDKRSLDYCLKMLKTDNEEILKEIEQHNSRLEKLNNEKVVATALESAERILKRS